MISSGLARFCQCPQQTPSTGLRHLSFLWRKVPESDAARSVSARDTTLAVISLVCTSVSSSSTVTSDDFKYSETQATAWCATEVAFPRRPVYLFSQLPPLSQSPACPGKYACNTDHCGRIVCYYCYLLLLLFFLCCWCYYY